MAQSPATTDPAGEALQIRVLDAGTSNAPAGSHATHGLTVQVTGAAGAVVRDAAVIFRLPDSGSPARFGDGSFAAVTYTDADGKARANDVRWGDAPDSVTLRVTAVKGTAHAGLLFEQPPTSMATPLSAAVRQSVLVEPPKPISSPVEITRPQSISVSVTPQRAPETRPAVPGNLPAVSVTNDGEKDDDSPDTNVPARHSLGAANALVEAPDVSISSSGTASHGHSNTKWIAILAIAAGTGAALALVHKGSTSSSSSSSGISIGSPTISVGHP
jgi:hypothetical protein